MLHDTHVDPAALAKEVDLKPKPANYYGTMVGVVKKALKEWDEWRAEEDAREAAEAERQAEAAAARARAGAGTVEEEGLVVISGRHELKDEKTPGGNIASIPASPIVSTF